MHAGLASLKDHPLVGEVRGRGLIGAVELVADKSLEIPEAPSGKLGAAMNTILIEKGLISRPMYDAMALCPPMIVTEAEIDTIVEIMGASLDELHRSGVAAA